MNRCSHFTVGERAKDWLLRWIRKGSGMSCVSCHSRARVEMKLGIPRRSRRSCRPKSRRFDSVPPPCRANATEAEWLRKESAAKKPRSGIEPMQVSHHLAAQPWELARLCYDREVLTPQSEDDGPMTTRLDEFRIQVQGEYEARRMEMATLISLLDEGQPTVGVARCRTVTKINSSRTPGYRA